MPSSGEQHVSQNAFDQLLHDARQGSIEARNELFTQIRGYLTVVAVQEHSPQLSAKVSASDIVQQTLMTATQEFDQFRGDSEDQFRHWLRKILVNQSNDHYRFLTARRRDARQEQQLADDDSQLHNAREPADLHLTPCSAAIASEQIGVIQQSLAKLPPDLRQVLHLRNWERLSFSEIAGRLGVTTSVAAKLWYRALIELRRLYDSSE